MAADMVGRHLPVGAWASMQIFARGSDIPARVVLDERMRLARRHRHALCDTVQALGPDAATLCEPWSTSDLLAHLIIRERRPDTWPGILGGVLQARTDTVQQRVAATDLETLLECVRHGPPRWSPTALGRVDDAVNTTELVVHHEDVRRAQPAWAPIPPDTETAQALWANLRRMGRLLYRSAPVGVVVVAPGIGRAALRRPPAGVGTVVLTGNPLELTLHAFGRDQTADVRQEGEPTDVAALAGATRSV